MLFVQGALAIGDSDIKLNNISQHIFESIPNIITILNYDVKKPPMIKSNALEDAIGKDLANLIGKLDPNELNDLYRAVHFLKITPLRL